MQPSIAIRGLTFTYPYATAPALVDCRLEVPDGARCLLIGANGAGKTTLINIINGRFLLAHDCVEVLGRSAFHDTTLSAERVLLGGRFPLDVDLTVAELVDKPDVDATRRERLLAMLGVARDWHMHRVSDGQRRRVQILLGLMRPCRVLLLDEVTTDLDVIARADLLGFLRDEGVTILYATHIFDSLERWATHLAFLRGGAIEKMIAVTEFAGAGTLSDRVETWLRQSTTT